MEDVLETYQRPRDPDRSLVCLDETSKPLIAETRARIPPKPERPARHDYEYERNGVANLRPPRRSRLRESPQRLIRCAFPRRRENRAGSGQPEHPCARLALCRLPAPEARRLVERFEWHYTPKHGSWLDMAESELAVLARRRLSRRIPTSRRSTKKWPPGSAAETSTTPKPIGPPPTFAATANALQLQSLQDAASILARSIAGRLRNSARPQ
jgi:hypothetical protein